MTQWWRNVLDKLTARAVRERLDKRRLQAEIDTHRLYLLTTFRDRLAAGEHRACDSEYESSNCALGTVYMVHSMHVAHLRA
jgi:hypothetical protein